MRICNRESHLFVVREVWRGRNGIDGKDAMYGTCGEGGESKSPLDAFSSYDGPKLKSERAQVRWNPTGIFSAVPGGGGCHRRE